VRRDARQSQRGNVVATVSAIGVAGTLALSAVMNSAVVLEERAIDANLAETRAYWGAMGQFRYALSRAIYSEACHSNNPSDCESSDAGFDSQKATGMQSYLNEISSWRELTYREEPAAYVIRLTAGTAAQDDTAGIHPQFSGYLMMSSGLDATQSTLPVLKDLAPRLPRYEIRFCLGLASAAADCGPIGSNNGGAYTPHYKVGRLSRLPN
jgi:hypothetical protein